VSPLYKKKTGIDYQVGNCGFVGRYSLGCVPQGSCVFEYRSLTFQDYVSIIDRELIFPRGVLLSNGN